MSVLEVQQRQMQNHPHGMQVTAASHGSQLAANRDEAVKNYCKEHTRRVARTWLDSVSEGHKMRAKLEEKCGAVGDSLADQREEEDYQAGKVAGYPLGANGKLDKNTDMPIDQSYSERQLFEKAYDRLLGEVSIVLKISEEEGKAKLNKSLGKKIEEISKNQT